MGNRWGRTRRVALVLAAVAVCGAVATSAASTTAQVAPTPRIAFVRSGDVYTIAPDGTNLTRLTTGMQASEPAWSPDGSRLAVVSVRDGNAELYSVGTDGSGIQRLTNDPADDRSPSWAPDGATLVFASDRHAVGTAHDLYVLAVDGSVTRLTSDACVSSVGACGGGYSVVESTSPAWSGDGTTIAFEKTQGTTTAVRRLPAAGGAQTTLTAAGGRARDPSWAGDSTWVVVSGQGSPSGLFVVPATGGGSLGVPLPDGGECCYLDPSWSGGSKIVAVAPSGLHVLDVNGGALAPLTNVAGDAQPAWLQLDGGSPGVTVPTTSTTTPIVAGKTVGPLPAGPLTGTATAPSGEPAPSAGAGGVAGGGAAGTAAQPSGGSITDPAGFGREVPRFVPDDVGRPRLVASIFGPDDVPTALPRVAASLFAALLLVILLPFPAELFNSTLAANYDEVCGWFGAVRRFVGRGSSRPRVVVGFGVLVLVSAGLNAFLDPSFGWKRASLALFVGLAASIAAVSVVSSVPQRLYMWRRYQETPFVRLYPAGLVVAAACVMVSRLVGYEPGYLYGLIAGWAFARACSDAESGRLTVVTTLWMFAIAGAAWFLWLPVKDSVDRGGAGLVVLVIDAALAALFAAGVGGTLFGLLPIRFLAGETLFRWSRPAWGALFGFGAFTFFHTLVSSEVETSMGTVVTSLVLFLAFGALSVAFWSYFRFRRRPAVA